ncbi:transglycosylase SLT domain-containing protein [Rothia sp. AR01]|uniref:Transglycosylase SLT domain-containing protein n=1 Tax=Rothia santali TaxID=2949643 RepID=A0A9X2HA49_9MICC|nr:transglycosylase SLT domain-containing protein [Rothia santali]MCP3425819.1 transglycosylase SLT domain-containing protein [Rothia santali]
MAGKAAKFGIKAALLKLFGPILAFFGVALLLLAFMLFLLINAGLSGGAEQAESESQRVETAGNSCSITSEEGEGGDAEGKSTSVPAEYAEDVKKASEEAGIPEQIIAAQIQQESQWDPTAGSHAGAQGIAQFMPATWATYGEGGDIHDGHDGIAALGRYMKDLKGQVSEQAGDDSDELIRLTLAAYNAGPGAVHQHDGVPPYDETRHYVETITGNGQTKFSEDCSPKGSATAWDGDLGDGEWTNPCPGCQFTSGYGPRNVPGLPAWAQNHVGVDLATPGAGNSNGTDIIAPTDMTVVGFLADDGCVMTRQKEGPGFFFAFCHMNSNEVEDGQELKRGDIIGVEGNTAGGGGGGVATHLHLEIYDPESPDPPMPYNDHNIDPEPILKEKGAWPE